jgi:hypothetical protein
MITLTPFSQGALLRDAATDPITRQGVCVALCDYWLTLIKRNYNASPSDRLRQLQTSLSDIIKHQQRYAHLRAQHGREEARRQVGDRLGLDYNDQTMIMKAPNGMSGIRQKLAADIHFPGAAATWSLRFANGHGHAIAGFCGISGKQPIVKFRLHVFDPNIGEYIGELQELDEILRDLLNKFPKYSTVEGVHRTTEG